MTGQERRLAAIMFTDIVGFTALAQSNENLALALLRKHKELLRPLFTKFEGREVKTMGDAFLVEFTSALAATECAAEIQRSLRQVMREGEGLQVRIGIHVGDVIHEGGDIYGDAVNVASRIQPLAQGGEICISQQVYDQVRNKVGYRFSKLEPLELRNVSVPIDAYRMEPLEDSRGTMARDIVGTRRLAVLPFVNMSPDPNDEYFADGLTEEIIAAMSKIGGLRVIARTSVMAYRKGAKKIGEIASELKVGSILEGSVRKAGDRIRITVQLIDSRTSDHLWTESYDRKIDNVLDLQSNISEAVAGALKVQLLSREQGALRKTQTSSPEAYTLYLKGRFCWNKRTKESLDEALRCFEESVKIDPSFALAYTGLSDAYSVLGSYNLISPDLASSRAAEFSRKAKELDPDLAEVHATNALVLSDEFKLKEAEEELKKAIAIKPSFASAHQWYYMILLSELRWEEALEQIETAAELDPFSPVIGENLAYYHYAKRNYWKALEVAERNMKLNPTNPNTRALLAGVYGKLGLFDDADREARTAVRMLCDSYPYYGKLMEALMAQLKGDVEKVKKLLPEIEAHREEAFAQAFWLATLCFFIGETDKGFEWLEHSYSRRETPLYFMKSEELLDPVRNDPRYLGMLRKIGLE